VIHSGKRQGLSEARVEDANGTLLAHATSRCVVQPLPFEPPEAPSSWPDVEVPAFDTADPHQRPTEGSTIPQEVWERTSGLELVQRWAKGERAPAPVCMLLGIAFADVEEGSVTVSMPASAWFCTGFGTFYGGAVSAFADAAITTAVMTTLPEATTFGTLDLKVNFLRPVTPDDRDLIAQATVEQRGRTIAVTTCRIDDADGKRIAMASGSAMISSGRPWPRGTGD
jgi:uncharacterized protein (TIGR00369 family)